jgi:stearoyl-CoA desaturase (delta-9 desaturase)
MFSGIYDLPWWGYIIVALLLTHITIAGVTIFLHRHQAHRALDLHAIPSHFFRFWLWLTTGMVTKEWAAVHRKHHAKCETEDDPHSPQIVGINRVLWGGVLLYVKETRIKETIEKYGHGTPDDWLEHNLYNREKLGVTLMALINIVLFGFVPGMLIFVIQMLWIPFWAAGVINGIGHFWGYRNFQCEDASRNIVPWGILIGGEELHNNHHAYATSARLSNKWYEFDIGWLYIRIMEILGLAQVKKLAPQVRFETKNVCDLQTLQAVITHRYDVLTKYAKSLKNIYDEELRKLREHHHNLGDLKTKTLKRWFHSAPASLPQQEQAKLRVVLDSSKVLQLLYSMREELSSLWERSTESSEQLLKRLQDWCHRADASGIVPLQEFSRRLRCYA